MFSFPHHRQSLRPRFSGAADGDVPGSDLLLFDQAPVAMLIIDLQTWQVSLANQAASGLLGFAPDSLIGMQAGLLFPIDTAQLQQLLAGTNGRTSEATVLRGDGTTGLLRVRTTVLTRAGRQEAMVSLSAPVWDPDFRQQLYLEDFQEFAEGLPQGVYEMDTRFVLTFVNRAAIAMFKATNEDLEAGICVVDWIVPEERDEVIAVLSGALNGVRTPPRYWMGLRRDGSTFPVMIHSTPIVRRGNVVGHRGLLIDISELHRSQEDLRAANRKLTLLNSLTRHDIQNQLTALLGYLGLIEDCTDDPELLRFVNSGRVAALAVGSQIEFTRVYQEIGVSAPEWQHLGTVFARAAAGWRPKGVTITIEETDLLVYADPMFEKVFSNLIDNALRYGGTITRIRLGASVTDAGCQITCADDGQGVRDDQKERIFQKGIGRHTGFGLFLAREILQLTGITIAETGVYGEGAVFTISVPEGEYCTRVQ